MPGGSLMPGGLRGGLRAEGWADGLREDGKFFFQIFYIFWITLYTFSFLKIKYKRTSLFPGEKMKSSVSLFAPTLIGHSAVGRKSILGR